MSGFARPHPSMLCVQLERSKELVCSFLTMFAQLKLFILKTTGLIPWQWKYCLLDFQNNRSTTKNAVKWWHRGSLLPLVVFVVLPGLESIDNINTVLTQQKILRQALFGVRRESLGEVFNLSAVRCSYRSLVTSTQAVIPLRSGARFPLIVELWSTDIRTLGASL